MNQFIELKEVTKAYPVGGKELLAADQVSFSIDEGEFVVLLGPSGAGKSTLLHLLGGMESPTAGEILVRGVSIGSRNEKALTSYRAKEVGFVFQFYNLIPTLTALENVALMREVTKEALDAREVLDAVGMGEHLHQFPPQLSGGEQQRVSIARALCKNPAMLLCDEPTGALDSETGTIVLKLLQTMSREKKKTVILVTHNAALAEAADKVIRMKNGKVVQVTVNEAPVDMSEVSW